MCSAGVEEGVEGVEGVVGCVDVGERGCVACTVGVVHSPNPTEAAFARALPRASVCACAERAWRYVVF